MTSEELKMLQALPLDVKVMKTRQRIREFVDYYGIDGVYVSYSGGKDSTVLLDICKKEYPDIQPVFVNTGLEYPEVVNHVKGIDGVVILRPKINFKEVIETYGYPITSKEQAQYLHEIRTTQSETLRKLRLEGNSKGQFKLSKKWHIFINSPFKVSHKCCAVMKKNPIKAYERKSGRVPIVGTMANESNLRKTSYIKKGCNSFTGRAMSQPLGFWTEQDILQYIKNNNLKIAEVYGEIVKDGDILRTTKCDRTGCVFCMFGVEQEKGINRFQRLKVTHPKLHDYCMNNLGCKEILEFIGVKGE